MDEADISYEYENRLVETARAMRKPVPKYTGLCLNCGARSDGAYCSPECQEDWEKVQKMKAINGK